MHRSRILQGTMIALFLVPTGLAAWAQAPAVQLAAATPATPAAQAAPAATPAAPPRVVNDFRLDLGWGNTHVSGSLPRYEQYVTPPSGLFLGDLGWRSWRADGRTLLDLNVEDLSQPSQRGNLWLSLDGGTLVLRGLQRHSNLYPDWDDPESGSSQRSDGNYDLTARVGRGEVRASYKEVERAPTTAPDADHWRDSTSALSYTAHLGTWGAGASYSNERFSFPDGEAFSGNAGTTTLSLTPPLGDRTFLEGTAAMTRTALDNQAQAPTCYRLALQGSHFANSNLTLLADMSYYAIHDSIAQTAHADQGSNTQLTAEYCGLWHTTVDLGGGVRTVHYINDQQDETTWTHISNLQAKAVTRFARSLKLKLSATRSWEDDRPIAFDLGGTPIGALVWSSQTDQRAELSWNPTFRTGMTANWHELKAENRDLAESNSVIDQSLYGWWMPRDQLTLYGTVMQEDFGLMGPSFQNYATDTKTWTLGGSYQFGPQTFGDLSYTKVVTNGFLGADDRVWAVGLSHHWHSGARLSMDLAIDSFRTSEDTPTLDYEGSHAEVRFTPAAF